MKAAGAALLLLVAAPAGCLTGSGGECSSDGDCAAGGVCTRTDECVPAGSAIRVVVRWTVNGQAPTTSRPEPCAEVGELEVIFRDPGGRPESYRPVPCDLGQTVYDKMPPRFESVEVRAMDRSGDLLASAREDLASRGETAVQVDLSF